MSDNFYDCPRDARYYGTKPGPYRYTGAIARAALPNPKDVSGIKAAGPIATIEKYAGHTLTVEFLGSFKAGFFASKGRRCATYTNTGEWTVEGLRLRCPGMEFSRHASKVSRILHGSKILFSR